MSTLSQWLLMPVNRWARALFRFLRDERRVWRMLLRNSSGRGGAALLSGIRC